MLEGAGTTSADSTANGHTITLNNTVTWTTLNANAVLSQSTLSIVNCTMANAPFTLAGSANWSIAWRARRNVTGNPNGIMLSNNTAGSFILIADASECLFRPDTSAGNGNFDVVFNGTDLPSGWCTYDFVNATHDCLLVYDHTALTLRLYVDGLEEEQSPKTAVSNANAAITFNSVGGGYDPAGDLNFVGLMEYIYIWGGRALAGADATALHADPYAFFIPSGGGTSVIVMTTMSGGPM
jgi:hypothetical protein